MMLITDHENTLAPPQSNVNVEYHLSWLTTGHWNRRIPKYPRLDKTSKSVAFFMIQPVEYNTDHVLYIK